MCELVDREMRDGALGIASALEYAPAYYADTDELIALCKVAARHKGKYITHMRSEGERLLEGIDEVIRISREANIPAEIYHFKAAGKDNWKKMDAAIARVEAARRAGLPITANMYCYTAGAAPLTACIPPWAMEGGEIAMRRRLARPGQPPAHPPRHPRQDRLAQLLPQRRLARERPADRLQARCAQAAAGQEPGADRSRTAAKTRWRRCSTCLLEDQSSIGTAYFITAEENIRKLVPLPWISFGSDEASQSPEGVFLKSMPHPRAYGNFARLLGKYVREEKLLTLEAAIRKLSHLPATNLGLDRRGLLQEGYFADVVVFDPNTIGGPGDLREAASVRRRRCGMSSSTALRCSKTANTPARNREGRCGGRARSIVEPGTCRPSMIDTSRPARRCPERCPTVLRPAFCPPKNAATLGFGDRGSPASDPDLGRHDPAL